MDEKIECWATFHGKGGYDYQNKEANQVLTVGEKYKIVGGEIERNSTRLILEEHPEMEWNSVMFDYDREIAPLEKTYLGVPRNLILAATKSYPAEMDGNSYYQEDIKMETPFCKFLNYAEEKGWNTLHSVTIEDDITFLNRGVQDSWELWQAARKF